MVLASGYASPATYITLFWTTCLHIWRLSYSFVTLWHLDSFLSMDCVELFVMKFSKKCKQIVCNRNQFLNHGHPVPSIVSVVTLLSRIVQECYAVWKLFHISAIIPCGKEMARVNLTASLWGISISWFVLKVPSRTIRTFYCTVECDRKLRQSRRIACSGNACFWCCHFQYQRRILESSHRIKCTQKKRVGEERQRHWDI
jgi:hypothetical protein